MGVAPVTVSGPARRSRPGGRDATESWKTTYAVADVHARTAISRTFRSISHVRLPHGPGRASPVRTTVAPMAFVPTTLRQTPDSAPEPFRFGMNRTCWTTWPLVKHPAVGAGTG